MEKRKLRKMLEMMIHVKQINLNKSKLSYDTLCTMINKDTAELYLIQEPYYYKGRLSGLPRGYKSYGEPDSRAIIIASDRINSVYVHEFSRADITVCQVTQGDFTRFYASVYLDITHEISDFKVFTNFVDSANNLKQHAILGIDCNSHSVLWGCNETNSRGEKLEEFIMSKKAHIINVGNEPTFITSRTTGTIIDITLALGQIEDIEGWEVNREYQFSDHRMLQFNVSGFKAEEKQIAVINWEKFKKVIRVDDLEYFIWDEKTIEKEALALEIAVKDAIKMSTKMKPVKKLALRWWNQDLEIAKNEVKKLVKLYWTKRTAELNLQVRAAKHTYYNKVRKAKRAKWQEYCSSIESPESMALLNKVINKKSHHKIGLLQYRNGNFAKSMNESVELLMDEHFPGSVPFSSRVTNATCHRSKKIYGLNRKESYINEFKVIEALKTFGPDKAPGPDEIKPRALQMLCGNAIFIKRLTLLYKACIEVGYTPLHWRESKVIFIPKPGKKDYAQVRSFRPISLTSILFKTLERITLWHLEETTLKEKPLGDNQHAFRKGYSTSTGLSDLVDVIESSILRQEYALAVFCDIEGAFDNVLTSSALEAMENFNVPSKIIAWYEHYLKNRYAHTSINEIDEKRRLTKGTAQGGVMSPVIFAMVFQSFLDLYKGPVKAKGFADDGVLIIRGSVPDVLVDLMQQALKLAEDWGKQHCMRLSPQKTNAMLFHRKNKLKMPKKLKMGGVDIEYTETTKYLGVHLDMKLRWNYHIENKIKGAKGLILSIKNAIGSIWGPSPRALKWAYSGIILPYLTYGSIVWSRVCKTTTIRNKLTKLNRLMCLTMMPLRRSTPTAGLEVILHIPPIDLKIEEITLREMTRVLPHRRSKWDGVGKNGFGHLKEGQKELERLGINPMNTDRISGSLNLCRGYTVNLDSFESGTPDSESHIKCYTDGSKLQEKVGYGLGITLNDELISRENGSLDDDSSVFQAEVIAIHRACVLLKELETKRVTIFSDSQSALQALAAVQVTSLAVKNCIAELNDLAQAATVELKWVKGHAQHTGNEYADMEAKSGTTNVGNKIHINKSYSHVKSIIYDSMEKKWNKRWDTLNTCRQTKIWMPAVNKRKSKLLINQDRTTLGLIVQMLTGHTRLNRHESLINPEEEPNCRYCLQEEETPWHVIGACPRLMNVRLDCFGLRFLEDIPEWTPQQLLKFCQKANLKELNKGEATLTP